MKQILLVSAKEQFMTYKITTVLVFVLFFSVTYIAQTTNSKSIQIIESREVNLKGCIQTHFQKEYVIKSEVDYLKAIRNDASRTFCLEHLEKIDFGKNSLVGIEVDSGYCRRPVGINAVVTDELENKQVSIEISYRKPNGLCRAVSKYDFWLLVPKISESYKVAFKFHIQETL